jgi:leader peptidase (prepilin peptidase)/N-methyltransferase
MQVVSPMIVALAVVVGLCVGSFLNVVASRVPHGRSIVSPPSACPECGTPISPRDNVPVLSWLVLRGRCRSCGVRISPTYPLVEAGCAVLWGITAARLDHDVALVGYLIAVSALLVLAVIDIEHHRLPTPIIWTATALTAATFALAAAVDDRWADFGRAVAGAAIGFVALLLIHLVSPKGMGFGDVRLAALCGLLLGWMGLVYVPLGLYGGFVLGAIVGVALIAVKRAKFGRAIPFGPFLVAGTLLMVLVGGPLADAVRDTF